jgi:hypothetical protein
VTIDLTQTLLAGLGVNEELALLLGGIELCRTQRKNWYRKEELISKKVEEKAGI